MSFPFLSLFVHAAVVEWVLSKEGVLATELESDPRKALESRTTFGGRRAATFDDTDSEDD
ncbi:hypothetical protein EON66_00285 [archaeon]|nr:MAG: hypothetical protein EON66_00285 [archaeon]